MIRYKARKDPYLNNAFCIIDRMKIQLQFDCYEILDRTVWSNAIVENFHFGTISDANDFIRLIEISDWTNTCYDSFIMVKP